MKYDILFLIAFLFFSCVRYERNNPFDKHGTNYYPPSVHIVPDSIGEISDTIEFEAVAIDTNGIIIQYKWVIDSVEEVADSNKLEKVFYTVGRRKIIVIVTDNDSLTASDTNFVSVIPLPPKNVTAMGFDKEVKISWDTVDNATGYILYGDTIPTITKNDSIIINDTNSEFIHTGLVNNTTYYYAVSTIIDSFESNLSMMDSAMPEASYLITYTGNGATSGNAPADTNYYKAGATVTVMGNTGNLIKTGYTFTGWNNDSSGNGTHYNQADTFSIGAANDTLYAEWGIIPTYTVFYDGNEETAGNVPVDENNYEAGATVTVIGNTDNLVKTGYTFTGWNTDSSGNGTHYNQADTFSIGAVDDTLYAEWKIIPTYTVTYLGNGNTSGQVPKDGNKYKTGDTVTVLGNPGKLTKIDTLGWEDLFAGWNTDSSGNGNYYPEGAVLIMDTSNVILYAKWIFSGTLIDHDGNVYQTVEIGKQTWTTENLRTTHYNDGKPIPLITGTNDDGFCYYNDTTDQNFIKKFGVLYNWHSVNTNNLAPGGWHVPTVTEWNTLQDYLIANGYNWNGTTQGNEIGKSMAAKTIWYSSNDSGDVGNDPLSNNSSDFSALPGGYRNDNGNFSNFGSNGSWWSATADSTSNAHNRYLHYRSANLYSGTYHKESCFSVRLVKD